MLRVFSGEERDFGIIVHHCFVNFKPNIIGEENGRIDPVTHSFFAYFRTINAILAL